MYLRFFSKLERAVQDILAQTVTPALDGQHLDKLCAHIIDQAKVSFGETSWLDTKERFSALCRPLVADVHAFLAQPAADGRAALAEVHAFNASGFHSALASALADAWLENRETYLKDGTAESLLGYGTRKLYRWVRHDLGLRMRGGIDVDHESTDVHASRIYEGIVSGEVNGVLLSVFEEATTNDV